MQRIDIIMKQTQPCEKVIFLFSLKAGKNRQEIDITLTNTDQSSLDLRSIVKFGCSSMFTWDSKPIWNIMIQNCYILVRLKISLFSSQKLILVSRSLKNNDCKQQTSHGPEIHPRIWRRISYIVMSTVNFRYQMLLETREKQAKFV